MIDASYLKAEVQTLQRVLMMKEEAGTVRLTVELEDQSLHTICITSYADGILGISCGELEKSRPVKTDMLPGSSFTEVVEYPGHIRLVTTDVILTIDKDPYRMVITDPEGKTLLKEEPLDVDPLDARRMPPFGFSLDTDGKIIGTNLCYSLPYDEHFFGFGESFTTLDKRGLAVDVWNRDALGVRTDESYKNVPFFISSRGYGFFLNHAASSRFQMGSASTASWQVHAQGKAVEYLIIPAKDPSEILKSFTGITGRAPLPPLWSFGLWVSNGFFNADRQSMLQTAKNLRDLSIPSDVLHFDCYWLNDGRWCDLEWNEERFPEPEQMIEELSEMGFRSSLWINPYVSIESPMFLEGKQRGFFLRDTKGNVIVRDLWHSLEPPCAIIDVTNEEEVKWFKGKLQRLAAMGISVFKTDFGEDIPEDACYADGSDGKQMHNLYALDYNKIVYESISSSERKGIVWGRSGYTGSQKYPVCWSGDPATSFPAMAAVLRGGLSYGLCGIPFWSHDIGGFYGDAPTEELFIRWAQFGLFSSHSRCHGTTSRDPWAFGERALKIFRDYARLRYSLLPYIMQQAKLCTETGLPFIRPLLLDFSEDPTCWKIEDQYLFGSDILVAPVLEPAEKRLLYLPAGKWIDFHSRELYQGGQWICVEAPLETLPLFIRSGTLLPRLKREVNHTDQIDWQKDLYLEPYGDVTDDRFTWYDPKQERWTELEVSTYIGKKEYMSHE